MIDNLARFLLSPVTIAVLVLVAALIADHYGKQWPVRGLVAAAALLLTAVALLPVDDMLAGPLESAYARPALPLHVDGIVVLSGGLKLYLYMPPDTMGQNASVLRMVAGAQLARRYPGARFVYSGTSVGAKMRTFEFEAVERFMVGQGVAPGRTIYERASADTWQNLSFSKKLLQPKPGETWILVTSAMHMPRAMAVANRLGWKMLPWPSDYAASLRGHPLRPLPDRLSTIDHAVHEWIGRLVYAVEGKT